MVSSTAEATGEKVKACQSHMLSGLACSIWSLQGVPHLPGLQSETLSQKRAGGPLKYGVVKGA